MQDRPTAPELLMETARTLAEEILPAVPPERRFAIQVAAHTCAMLAREFEADDQAVRNEAGRLVALLGHGPERPAQSWAELREQTWGLRAELAAEIRAGAFDTRFDEVMACVRASVRDKLAVTHPGYAGEG
jgi:hypothetical protein